jgi:hypothetical protein
MQNLLTISKIYTLGLLAWGILIGWWWYVPSYCRKLQNTHWLADGLFQSYLVNDGALSECGSHNCNWSAIRACLMQSGWAGPQLAGNDLDTLAGCDLDGLAASCLDMNWMGSPSRSWMQAGFQMPGADQDGLAFYWVDTIGMGMVGWMWSGCDLDWLPCQCLETIERGGWAISLLAGHGQDRLALGQLNMIWTGWPWSTKYDLDGLTLGRLEMI